MPEAAAAPDAASPTVRCDMKSMIALTRGPIDYQALTEAVRRPHCGAVAVFLGTVRDLTGDQATAYLEYEAYVPMAEQKLAEIVAEAQRRWPLGGVAVMHRLGRLAIGEVSVAVAVSAPHRGEAFAACRYIMDTIKAVVPIWKKEIGPDGRGEWVHPSGAGTMREPPRPLAASASEPASPQ